jgi:hypothetical protein
VGLSPPNQFCTMGYPFRPPPLSANPSAIFDGVERAQDIYLGVRARLGGEAELGDGCLHGTGRAIAQGFESRAIGCGILPGTADWPAPPAVAGEQCTIPQEMFMDENLPIYFVLADGQAPDPKLDLPDKSVSKGPLMSLVRLGNVGDSVSCESVRNAPY